MGMVAFFLKGRISHSLHTNILPKFSLYTEVLIGISLIVIGLLGIKEASSFVAEVQEAEDASGDINGKKVRERGRAMRRREDRRSHTCTNTFECLCVLCPSLSIA